VASEAITVLLGGPGSGKGTQGKLLSQQLGVPHISSGELLRSRQIGEGTIDQGNLVDDEVAARVVFERLEQPDAQRGAILDGFPRTVAQAGLLDAWAEEHAKQLQAVYLEVPLDELRRRLQQRHEDRSDDTPATHQHRLAIFEQEMPPLVAKYERRGTLKRIDGLGSIEHIHQRLLTALQPS
jgi:adenylate kinase